MVQVVFKSDFQDEVSLVDPGVAGLTFVAGVPQTVTDEQAEILFKNPGFEKFETPNRFVPPPPVQAPEHTAAD